MSVNLRKYPYPFQAALSICSDIDGTSPENFIEIHKFLNTNKETSMGRGLELPMGDSFWMYDRPDIADHAFSYFENLNGFPSKYAPMLRDFIKAGIIDVMHSYGNFAAISDFNRQLAIQALEELDKHNLKLRVWTNHGGIESVQNLGENSSGKGDIPESNNKFYHADALRKYGVMFYWDSELSLATNVGQDSLAAFGDAYWKSPLYRGIRKRIKHSIKGFLIYGDRLIHHITHKHIVPWIPFNPRENNLISMDTLRDNNKILKFKRFGHGRFDWSDHLPKLLHQATLDKLIESRGALILYIHLGDRLKPHHSKFPLSKETIRQFKRIAELYHEGKIWITTTSRLLIYSLIRDFLDFQVEETARRVKIIINNSPIKLKAFNLQQEDFAGVTFVVPADKQIELFLDQKPIRYKKNPIDHFGRSSISLALPALEWPL